MNFSRFFSILLLLQALLEAETKSPEPLINVTKHLSFPDFSPNTNPRIHHDLKLLGDARLLEQQGLIQIPEQHLNFKAGRAIYASPVRLLDPATQTPASFTTTFSFQIITNPTTTNDSTSSRGGSGLTFIAVPDELTVGRAGRWLGMMNDACEEDYKAFAVEFDTRLSPEVGDPNDNHVGINLGSIVSAETIDASHAGISFNDGSVHRAWISYDGPQRRIDIRIGSDGGEFPSKPLFAGPLDLSNYLNEYMFVGFSASTGSLAQVHKILSWNFSSHTIARLNLPRSDACEEKLSIGSLEAQITRRKPPSSFLVFISVVVLCLVILLNFYCNSKRSPSFSSTSLPDKKQRPRPPNKPRRFPISELSSVTRCFSESEELGSDSRGIFYRGSMPNGSQVAVKRFSSRFLNSTGTDRRRVLKEIGELSRVRHPNLASIRGWCCDKREAIVVYEYMHNGSLDKWLFSRGVLSWTRRVKVLRDVGEGLRFLHEKKLAHKNLKTSSVLLDVSFRTVLGDFGFGSNWVDPALGQKADVYEFGMLAMEIVAGRRRTDSSMGKEEVELLDFAWRMREKGETVKVVDRSLRAVFNEEQAIRFMEVGLLCTLNESKTRPSMQEVVMFLNFERELPELPLRRPVTLYSYSSSTDVCRIYACAPFMQQD